MNAPTRRERKLTLFDHSPQQVQTLRKKHFLVPARGSLHCVATSEDCAAQSSVTCSDYHLAPISRRGIHSAARSATWCGRLAFDCTNILGSQAVVVTVGPGPFSD